MSRDTDLLGDEKDVFDEDPDGLEVTLLEDDEGEPDEYNELNFDT